ncbi:hypothetical protein ES705_07283 [subsurface metagenome]
MSTTLKLKKRKTGISIMLDSDQLRVILRLPTPEAKDRLHDMFSRMLDSDSFIHDRRWLEMIVNFVAVGREGRPTRVKLTEQAKWLKLAERVAEIDDAKENDFTLTAYQETIIWERLNSEEFTIAGMPSGLAGFILDFLDATGRRFANMEPEKDEDDKPSKKDKNVE